MVWVDDTADGELDRASAPRSRGRRLSRPPGWWFHGLLIVAVGGVIWGQSYPGPWIPGLVVAVPLLVVVVGVWFLRLVVHLWALGQGRAAGRTRWLAVLPVTLAVTLVLTESDLPFQVRWQLSEASFEDALVEARAAPLQELNEQGPLERRIGLYLVDFVYRADGDVFFREARSGLFGTVGFACLRAAPKQPSATMALAEIQYHRLRGCWYKYYRNELPYR
jgi:hypothetical protein